MRSLLKILRVRTECRILDFALNACKERKICFFRPLSHFIVFQHPADDWAVARFIKNSSEHSSKLDSAFQQLAEVTILNQVRGEKKVEYHFRPASVSML